jgi:hypothetical protein
MEISIPSIASSDVQPTLNFKIIHLSYKLLQFETSDLTTAADCEHSCRTMHFVHEFCSLQIQVLDTGTKEADGRNMNTVKTLDVAAVNHI